MAGRASVQPLAVMSAKAKAPRSKGGAKKSAPAAKAMTTTYLPLSRATQAAAALQAMDASATADNYLEMCLPLPPDVDSLLVDRGSWSGSSYTSTATPTSSIDTPPTGTKPKMRAPAKKSKPSGAKQPPTTTAKAVASKQKPNPAKQQQDEVASDMQLAKEGLRREREAKLAAMRQQDLPEGPFMLMPKRPTSPRRRSRPHHEMTTTKDAELALLLGLAGMKPAPRSFAVVDETKFAASTPSVA